MNDQITWPAVTCLCPTYGRFQLLRDALACFLAQDYPGEKRLLILNDAPKAFLLAGGICEDAEEFSGLEDGEVYALQTPNGFANLGHKRQMLLECAQTPIVAHWDDDDLYLPWHLTRSVIALLKHNAGCVKSAGAWYLTGPRDRLVNNGIHHNVFEGSMVFYRDRALELGGYPPLHSGQAAHLMNSFHRAGELYPIPDTDGPVSYVYRWSQGCGHISSWHNAPDSAARFRAANTDFGDGRPLTPGDLSPYWDAALKSAREVLSKPDYAAFEAGLKPVPEARKA